MAVTVSQQSLIAHHTGRLSVSVSTLALVAHTAAKISVNVSQLGLIAHHTDQHKPVPVSSLGLVAHHTDEHKPVPVASMAMVVHRSIGHYMKVNPFPVEPEVPITGVRFKVMSGEMMRQAYFIVQLDHAHTKPVSVRYTTVPGTAVPPAEYKTEAGILTFNPGETAKLIVIPVREEDEDIQTNFTVLLTQPINAVITDGEGKAEI